MNRHARRLNDRAGRMPAAQVKENRMMKPLFDAKRVETAAGLIAAELRRFVCDDGDGAGSSLPCLRAYPINVDGLTCGERLHAIVRALGLVQLEVLAELGTMWFEGADHHDGDGETRFHPHQLMDDSELLKHLGLADQGPDAAP
jgi:hypothetical protein